jgi:translation initiation factor 5B
MSKFFAKMQQEAEQEEEKPQEAPAGLNALAPPAEADDDDAKKGGKNKKKKGKKDDKEAAETPKDAKVEPAKPAAPEKVEPAKTEVPKAESPADKQAKAGDKKAAPDAQGTPKDGAEADGEEGDDADEKEEPGKPSAGGKKKKEKKKPVSQAAQLAAEKMRKKKEEEELIKKLEEEAKRKEEEERLRKEEEERKRKEEEERIAAEKAAEKQRLKDLGLHKSKAEKRREQAQKMAREQLAFTMQNYQKAPEHKDAEPEEIEEIKPERKQSRAEKKAEEKAAQALHEMPKKKKSEKIDEIAVEPTAPAEAQPTEEAKVDDVEDWEKLISLEEADKAAKELEHNNAQAASQAGAKKQTKGRPKGHKKGDEAAKPGEDFGNIDEEAQMEPEEQEKIYSSAKEAFYVKSKYRCPIICILGHVDTGKTKILDKIRRTNVQCGEEGGITQQIGASFFPQYKLKEEIAKLDSVYKKIDVEIPGLLIIDTPGHESFANLRKRGESLCDFAILVVDIKHGLENQTIESLNMLKEKGTPFIVAMNKIDILASWKPTPDGSSLASLKKQEGYTQNLYDQYFNKNQNDFAQNGILIQNYWENVDRMYNQSVVPTSAHTGEGIPDLLGYITEYCQTELAEKITPKDAFNCTVMEVKKIDGLGTTIDVVLLDGTLKEGDKIILSGFEGPIETTIRALLTPQPLKELRVKADYIHHEELKGAMGCKIAAPGLEKAIAGTSLYKYTNDDELPEIHELLAEDIAKVRKMVKFKNEGVGVIASTLGSLEALLVRLSLL